ncbi:MAG: hypothetical protein ACD_12C00856G0002 [uncultured bacterium]|uniref:DUF5666 domain-containing protein n=1 Tax=Candidatus Roizmanbacteria bacterium GW2011_GWA2_35_8 TaxID=1618479 RepID=A0A0G0DB98_9BACT|nr:MAG: hypothetical protein ACD_12C00856G0002 [uncultured bacterium]KKP85891.1 MAG: hypothetical protein UR89_C0039G0004 [Candidatus Roizmanbacteria bacterium GW2011_GWA2_35_8]
MKKTLLISLLVTWSLSCLAISTYGQTETASQSASPTTTSSAEESDIKVLKEKVANKVSEIRQKNNKAISGFVISNKSSFITLKTYENEEFEVELDDTLTKYFKISGTQKKEIEADVIEKDDYIIVTGVLIDKKITANSIFVDEGFLVETGKVTEIDKENYSIKIVTTAKDNFTLDIENSTKQSMLNIKTNVTELAGFSKIKEGDTVHFVVKQLASNKNNSYSAVKILIIPQEYFLK